MPRDHWLEDSEKQAIVAFHQRHPLEGYRRLTYMMMDQDIVAVSPATTYRVLSQAGVLDRRLAKNSTKGDGFEQPHALHDHWHVDISYINVAGTFYYLCSILEGKSRSILHWKLRESMTEKDVELVIEEARVKFPNVCPRIISDNGPQFIANDFKKYIRYVGMTHVRTSPYYPQSNGKIERWHRTLKSTAIRMKTPRSLDEAIVVITAFVKVYNDQRLHSALGYVTPRDVLEGRQKSIWSERDRKIAQARERRALHRQQARTAA